MSIGIGSSWDDTTDVHDYIGDMYIIEKLWYDYMENHPSNAYGYEVHGYTSKKSEADKIVELGGMISKDECWAFSEDIPLYRIKAVEKMTY